MEEGYLTNFFRAVGIEKEKEREREGGCLFKVYLIGYLWEKIVDFVDRDLYLSKIEAYSGTLARVYTQIYHSTFVSTFKLTLELNLESTFSQILFYYFWLWKTQHSENKHIFLKISNPFSLFCLVFLSSVIQCFNFYFVCV